VKSTISGGEETAQGGTRGVRGWAALPPIPYPGGSRPEGQSQTGFFAVSFGREDRQALVVALADLSGQVLQLLGPGGLGLILGPGQRPVSLMLGLVAFRSGHPGSADDSTAGDEPRRDHGNRGS
jgi:hypothetical protein